MEAWGKKEKLGSPLLKNCPTTKKIHRKKLLNNHFTVELEWKTIFFVDYNRKRSAVVGNGTIRPKHFESIWIVFYYVDMIIYLYFFELEILKIHWLRRYTANIRYIERDAVTNFYYPFEILNQQNFHTIWYTFR